MGSVVLDGFRLLQFVETDDAWNCYGRYFLIHTALRLLFVFAQAFFLFKNHKVIYFLGLNNLTKFLHYALLLSRNLLIHFGVVNCCLLIMIEIIEN